MADSEIPPPSNVTVHHEHRPTLYQADGKPLVRCAGFVPQGVRMAIQTTGQAPAFTVPKIKYGGKGGKKGGGKKC